MILEAPPENSAQRWRVSVLMPTYNQQEYVEEAIAAILAQEAPPFELIVSDDCSTDDTWERVVKSATNNNGCHIVRLNRNRHNLGINGNLNKLISLASGEIMICAAGDDISSADRVSRIVSIFAAEAPLLVYSNVHPLPLPGQTYDGRFENLIFDRTTDPVAIAGCTSLFVGATVAWHRDLFTLFGPLPEDNVYEDLILGFRAALAGRVGKVDAALVSYRMDVGVSAKMCNDLSLDDWTAKNLEDLKRHAATLAYRRADALNFGLAGSDPVIRALDKCILSNSIRMDYWLMPLGRLLLKYWRHPHLTVRRIQSERRRKRKSQQR